MAKEKKISVSAIDKVMKELEEETVISWNGIDVTVKKMLPISDMTAIVRIVADNCFAGEDQTYMPEMKEFMLRTMIIGSYTNITMPQNIDHQYRIVFLSNLYYKVCEYICGAQLNDIITGIDERIKYALELKASEMYAKINEIVNVLNDVSEKMGGAFESVNSLDVQALMGAIAEGGIDENKIARAVMEARKENEQ